MSVTGVAQALPQALGRLAIVKPPDDKVTPGTWGFVIVAALATATFFLLRSFVKQLHRVDFVEKPVTGVDPSAAEEEPPPSV